MEAPNAAAGAAAPAETPLAEPPMTALGALEWPEVQVAVLRQLPLPDLMAAATASPCLAASARADAIWRPLCERRWRGKWGFAARWARCTSEADRWAPWRFRFYREEADAARRHCITPEELQSLRFDFRMRLDVLHCASTEMRFGPASWDPAEPHIPKAEEGATCGSVSGHPMMDTRLTWVLDPDGRGLQWGIWPNYWPKGFVRRLPTWGWEVINPNVVMRAQDDGGNRAGVGGAGLWEDLLDDLVPLALRSGVRVVLPRAWVQAGDA
mmetsp:Transcript_127112/g.395612  ORF Transcript_127112/g.395612 Transcript_127112/m.395612 type:complete len:268 (+) Transcript_127112:43-846(+)